MNVSYEFSVCEKDDFDVIITISDINGMNYLDFENCMRDSLYRAFTDKGILEEVKE